MHNATEKVSPTKEKGPFILDEQSVSLTWMVFFATHFRIYFLTNAILFLDSSGNQSWATNETDFVQRKKNYQETIKKYFFSLLYNSTVVYAQYIQYNKLVAPNWLTKREETIEEVK